MRIDSEDSLRLFVCLTFNNNNWENVDLSNDGSPNVILRMTVCLLGQFA